jgi:hypothetical protein
MNKNKNPNEIPTQKTPHNPEPLKDPARPGNNNPVNPKTDEGKEQTK